MVGDAFELVKKILRPWVPKNLITEELSGIYGNAVLAEMGEIIKYYGVYNNGADFPVSADDYIPSQLRFKKIRALIDKEVRFMFAKPLDIKINPLNIDDIGNPSISNMQAYINNVLQKNHFNANIIRAAKDCFIGKRIAIVCNFDLQQGINISFLPSLEFVYDTDDYGNLNKIITFFALNNANDSNKQRIQKRKYWLEKGVCHISKGIYDGAGNLIEEIIKDETLLFNYIPAVVVLNDGLTGDCFGESEVVNLFDYEQAFSKIANLDIDAEKKSMNPIHYALDMTAESTKGEKIKLAPGAFWDLQSDTTARDETTGEVGILEANLKYSEPLANTLNRIRDTMYEQIDMPSVSTSDLKGIVSSGKTLKAIYWSLIVRCDEKIMVWKSELETIIKCLIDGAKLYPDVAALYTNGNTFDDVNYVINIENNYPLPEDEAEEKEIDLAEVSHKTRSIKSYLKKWRNLTDKEIDDEIKQIAIEKQMLEESYFPVENPLNQNNEIDEM